MRKLVTTFVIATAAFLLNPLYACEQQEANWQFSEADMKAAIAGTWEVNVKPHDGAPWTMTFRIEQAGAPLETHTDHGRIRSAAACNDRTPAKSAGAGSLPPAMPLAT